MQGSTEASTSKLPTIASTGSSSSVSLPASPSAAHAPSAPSKGKGKEQTWRQVISSGVAGGIAGCVAKTSVAPLDRVKILFQTGSAQYDKYSGTWTGVFRAMNQIYKEAGVRGLLQGHSATLLRIFPYAGIKFMAYDALHKVLMPTPEQTTSARLFVAGAAAGVTSVFLTYPLELIRVRLAYDRRLPPSQLQGHSALIYSVLKIYHEGDPPHASSVSTTKYFSSTSKSLPAPSLQTSVQPYFKNPTKAVILASSLFQTMPLLKFYRGFVVSIIGMVPYAGTSFLVWGYLKKRIAENPRFASQVSTDPDTGLPDKAKASTTVNLACGAVAGAAAQTASYPFEVVRRRMQVGGLLRPDRFYGFVETLQYIYRNKGLGGFFVGLSIGYLKVIPLTAISFATWEAVKKVLDV